MLILVLSPFFFFNLPAPTKIYTLSLHDALPISDVSLFMGSRQWDHIKYTQPGPWFKAEIYAYRDRKSTRLNSSHGYISYAVFCLKKKKRINENICHSYVNVSIDLYPELSVHIAL